jgi:hypothetical protein
MDMDALSRFFLHFDEISILDKIHNPMHRWQYLLGRIAVKDALRSWQAGPSGKMHHPAGMIIEAAPTGKLTVKNNGDAGPVPQLAICCSELGALALVSAESTGIDLARILASVENSKASA